MPIAKRKGSPLYHVLPLVLFSSALLTCSESHVSKKTPVAADKQPAELKLESSNKGSDIVTLKVSVLDEDGEVITTGVYASGALKFKHRCGGAEMVIDEQYAVKGIARILFHRATEDCTVSVEYSNVGASLEVKKRAVGATPVVDPITFSIVDVDGTAITSSSKFTRIGIRDVGIHITYNDKENKSHLVEIPATIRLMCDYDDDDTTYEKRLCVGSKKPNPFGVADKILSGDAADTWDSDGDGHNDGNEPCFANVFTETCQLEGQLDIIIGGKGKLKKTQKFVFHQLDLELQKSSGTADLPSAIKRGFDSTTAISASDDDILKSIHVYPRENEIRLDVRDLDAFRPLAKSIAADGRITVTRAAKHNLHVRIGVKECKYPPTPISLETVIYRQTTGTPLTHANPRLPAEDYDSQKISIHAGKVYAKLFDTPAGWYRLAWDRLFKYEATQTPPVLTKHGPGMLPIDKDATNLCDGKCFIDDTSTPPVKIVNPNCQCSTGKSACLVDGDDGNCHEHRAYTCRSLHDDDYDDEQCGSTHTALTHANGFYKQTSSCAILAEMSRGEIEALDHLPVCSDDPATRDNCYGNANGYDDLSDLKPAADGKFCQQGMCKTQLLPNSNENVAEKHKHAQTCELKASPAKPTTWQHGTANSDWSKCAELIAIRRQIDSWHKSPAWAQKTIITTAANAPSKSIVD